MEEFCYNHFEYFLIIFDYVVVQVSSILKRVLYLSRINSIKYEVAWLRDLILACDTVLHIFLFKYGWMWYCTEMK